MTDIYQERYRAHQKRKREVLMGLLEERHSERVFADEDVPAEALADVLHAAERAPSSCARRGVSTRVVTERDDKALLGGLLVGGVGWVHRAPVVMLLMGDLVAYKAGDEVLFMPFLDAGCMVGQIYLAATAAGLSCCFINPNIRDHNRPHFAAVFGDGIFCGALALGLPRNDGPPAWVLDTS
jgi:nitroreductase